jgi:hypothetical protein
MIRSLPISLTAGLLLSGCSPFEVDAYLHDRVNMLVQVNWTTEEAGISWVEYGLSDDYGMVTPASEEPGTDHHFSLLGMPPLSDVFYRAVTEIDGRERSVTGTIATGGVPAATPDFDINVYDPEATSEEHYILGTAFGELPWVYVIDREGNWLWYKGAETELDEGKNFIELNFERGTNNILYNSFLTDHGEDDSNVTRVSIDRSVDEDIDTPLGHHAFTELPDGSIAYLGIDVRDYDVDGNGSEESVVGDVINIVPPDGGPPTTFWSTWDWRTPVRHDRWNSGFYPQGGDWTHANSLHYYDASDTYLVSIRNFDVVLELDASTGEVLREFGGSDGYTLTEGSREFNYQHDVSWTAEGHLLMITTDDEARETSAVEYAVDDGAQTMDEVWSHGDGEGLYVLVQGTARDLSNGNRMVNFGSSGVVREVTLEGEVVWELSVRAGAAFGNTVPFSDLWEPGRGE